MKKLLFICLLLLTGVFISCNIQQTSEYSYSSESSTYQNTSKEETTSQETSLEESSSTKDNTKEDDENYGKLI